MQIQFRDCLDDDWEKAMRSRTGGSWIRENVILQCITAEGTEVAPKNMTRAEVIESIQLIEKGYASGGDSKPGSAPP